MVTGSLSRRYAKAMFDIGSQQGDLTKLGQDIRSLAKAMNESKELQSVLTNPALRRADRRRVVDGLLQSIGVQTASRNMVYILLEGERLANVPGISRALDEMIEAKAGRVTAEVTSAKPLDPSQLSQINAALGQESLSPMSSLAASARAARRCAGKLQPW